MATHTKTAKRKPLVGWREWVSLPELGLHEIKAKVDSGARTSALHAFALHPFKEDGKDKIRFDIHPIQRNTNVIVSCTADIIDRREISDSGGHTEERYIILTPLLLGNDLWPIEISLTERDTMLFRMLLGRSAIRRRYLINPGRSFIASQSKAPL